MKWSSRLKWAITRLAGARGTPLASAERSNIAWMLTFCACDPFLGADSSLVRICLMTPKEPTQLGLGPGSPTASDVPAVQRFVGRLRSISPRRLTLAPALAYTGPKRSLIPGHADQFSILRRNERSACSGLRWRWMTESASAILGFSEFTRGGDGTGEVVRAQDQRSHQVKTGLRAAQPGGGSELPHSRRAPSVITSAVPPHGRAPEPPASDPSTWPNRLPKSPSTPLPMQGFSLSINNRSTR